MATAAGLVIASVIGLAAGFRLGSEFAWLDSGPSDGPLPATLGVSVQTVLILGAVGLAGLVLLVFRSTRRAGWGALLLAGCACLGWPFGNALGPHWQPPRAMAGRVTVELTEPVATRLAADATCWTVANGDRIATVETADLGRIGIDELGLRLRPGETSGLLELPVNRRAGYSGQAAVTGRGPELLAGTASFSGLAPDRFRIGGASQGDMPPGGLAASGAVRWTCEAGAGGAGSPTPTDDPGFIEGWFVLRGVVDMPHPCEADGPCLPYGYAMGACSRTADLRTDELNGIVPWVDGHRARLHLVPGRETARLTVEADDGSPPETVTAPATLVERTSGTSSRINGRVLSADFPLREGRLGLTVDWWCGDNFE